jgi:hypothetical protein
MAGTTLGEWWSIPQGIIWIVRRSEDEAAAAENIRFWAEVKRLRLTPRAPTGSPPVPLNMAKDMLLRAASRDRSSFTVTIGVTASARSGQRRGFHI